jgi:hypothetical protein
MAGHYEARLFEQNEAQDHADRGLVVGLRRRRFHRNDQADA